jgi:histidinol dehydrogenase
MPKRLEAGRPGFEDAFRALVEDKRDAGADVRAAVADIINDVRDLGDRALFAYTKRFDRFDLTAETVRVGADEIAAARAHCAPETIDALRFAADRIRSFHERQMPQGLDYTDQTGTRLGYRWTPLDAVGLYVPGGTAAYPSSVLMNTVPAKVAGVGRLAMAVPTPDGRLNPLVLAAAELGGADEIYRIGGAQAIAALAYGTETIAPVDKIVGPGNAYVAEAKRQVFGRVGIDMIAGPSEILVVADRDNDPAWIAADLLSQAEHDVRAQAILITDDPDFAEAVAAAVEDQLADLPRAATARQSWRDHGAVIVVGNLTDAPALVNRLAPEHAEIATADPDVLAGRIHHAGALFLGRHSPEAVGDYLAGPNHVLPTGRGARFASGLGVDDFLKRTTLIAATAESLERIGPAAITLAEAEGLDAHARSIAIRLGGGKRE